MCIRDRFKSDNSAVDIISETKLSLETSRQYEDDLLKTEIQLEMLSAIGDILSGKEEIGILPVNIGIENQALSNAINKYNELVLERMRLGTETSDDNPVIREMNAQITVSYTHLDVYKRQPMARKSRVYSAGAQSPPHLSNTFSTSRHFRSRRSTTSLSRKEMRLAAGKAPSHIPHSYRLAPFLREATASRNRGGTDTTNC